METQLVLSLPYRVLLGNKRGTNSKGEKIPRYFTLNMNEYRNANFHILNNAKVKFKELIQDQLRPLPTFEWVTFHYTLYPASARDMDTNNFCSIVDKFFSDAFVEAGKLEDDNYRFLRDTRFTSGEIDRTNPRVEIKISGKIKEDTMQLQALLDNNDFNAALEAYVRSHFPIPEGTQPQIDITAGRGEKGYTAVVTFVTEAVQNENKALSAALKEHGNVMNRLDTPEQVEPVKAAPKAEEKVPNKETVAAIEAAQKGEVERAETIEDLFEATTAQTEDDEPFALSNEPEPAVQEAQTETAPEPLFSFDT